MVASFAGFKFKLSSTGTWMIRFVSSNFIQIQRSAWILLSPKGNSFLDPFGLRLRGIGANNSSRFTTPRFHSPGREDLIAILISMEALHTFKTQGCEGGRAFSTLAVSQLERLAIVCLHGRTGQWDDDKMVRIASEVAEGPVKSQTLSFFWILLAMSPCCAMSRNFIEVYVMLRNFV